MYKRQYTERLKDKDQRLKMERHYVNMAITDARVTGKSTSKLLKRKRQIAVEIKKVSDEIARDEIRKIIHG